MKFLTHVFHFKCLLIIFHVAAACVRGWLSINWVCSHRYALLSEGVLFGWWDTIVAGLIHNYVNCGILRIMSMIVPVDVHFCI